MRVLEWAMRVVIAATALTTPTLTDPQTVTLSAYSCEQGKETTGCAMTRWGGDVHAIGAACPPEWRDREIVIEGYEAWGVIRCDDTPKYSYLNGLPHIDVRLPTRQDAVNVGIQTRTIWSVER